MRISPLKNIAKETKGHFVFNKEGKKLKYRVYYPKPLGKIDTSGKWLLSDGRNGDMYNYLQLVENPMSVYQFTNNIASVNEDNDELVAYRKSIKDTSGRMGLNIISNNK